MDVNGSKIISLANFPNGPPLPGENVLCHLVRERAGEVLCAIPGIRPDEKLQPVSPDRLEIIHPDCGCIMRRNRQDRPVVPIHIMRLLSMSRAAQRAAQIPSLPGTSCFVCDQLDAGDVMLCPLCQLWFHETCTEKLLPVIEAEGQAAVHVPLPRCFAGAKVCQLCVLAMGD